MTRFQDLQLSRWDALARASLVASLLVALPAAVQTADAQGDSRGLFSPAEPSAFRSVAIPAPHDIAIRQREVMIDFSQLARLQASASHPTGPPTKLTLNLFDDTVLTAVVDQMAPTSSGYSLSGRIEGMEHGTMTLVVNGTVVAGSVRTPHGIYRVTSVGKSLYAISEVDESKLPPTL